MKIYAIYDKSGPKYHRVLLPCFLMDAELVADHRLDEEKLPGVDIVFLNRVLGNSSLQNILDLREKYGFKLIVDFDDHWRLDLDHYLYAHYQMNSIAELMEAYIKEADGITVTHQRLYDEVVKINPNCCICPNAIPEFDQFLAKKLPSKEVRLFWAGGITHRPDLELISKPILKLKNSGVKLVLGGYQENNQEWKQMAKLFTGNSSYNTEVLQALPVDKYYYMYSRCDIALIPLRDTFFNSMKSNLKILEAANIGAPVVVSRVDPYLGFPEDIVNYVDSYNPWYKQVKKLIDDPELRESQGKALREYCRQYFSFTKINEVRKQFFVNVATKQAAIREIPGEVRSPGLESVPQP